MKRLIFIFLDGVGIGKSENSNPFYYAKTKYLPLFNGKQTLPDGVPVKKIDPLLGVDGMPQSASGQTAIFTGVNIPLLLNGHRGSYPTKPMRKIIKSNNLLLHLREKKLKIRFINAYPGHSELFTTKHIEIHKDGRFHFSERFPSRFKKRISTTTCLMISNELTPCDENDILDGNSLYQDFSNKSLKERGLELPEFSPEQAAEIIYNTSQEYDFILYEYFQTDLYGHRHSFYDCVELIKKLNRLIEKLISSLDKNRDTLLITSDHGNIEDCSRRTHTKNQVPLIVWGNKTEMLRNSINTLTDITPGILNFFQA